MFSLRTCPFKDFAILVYLCTTKPLRGHCKQKASMNETTKARREKTKLKIRTKALLSDRVPHPDRLARSQPWASLGPPGGLASRWWPRTRYLAPAGAPTCAALDPQDSARARPRERRRTCAGKTLERVGGGLGARPRIDGHSRVRRLGGGRPPGGARRKWPAAAGTMSRVVAPRPREELGLSAGGRAGGHGQAGG